MFKTKNLYSPSERLKNDLSKVSKSHLNWIWIWVIATCIIILTQAGSHKPVKADQEAKVNLLLNEKVVEDYTTSLKGAPLKFGSYLKKDLGLELVGDYNRYQRKWMQFAWQISHHDKEFLYMLKAENGLLNHDRRSMVPGEPSYGFCQIHAGYHPHIVYNDKFSSPAWQLEQCYKLWKSGTKFYGYDRIKRDPIYRAQIESHFKFN